MLNFCPIKFKSLIQILISILISFLPFVYLILIWCFPIGTVIFLCISYTVSHVNLFPLLVWLMKSYHQSDFVSLPSTKALLKSYYVTLVLIFPLISWYRINPEDSVFVYHYQWPLSTPGKVTSGIVARIIATRRWACWDLWTCCVRTCCWINIQMEIWRQIQLLTPSALHHFEEETGELQFCLK